MKEIAIISGKTNFTKDIIKSHTFFWDCREFFFKLRVKITFYVYNFLDSRFLMVICQLLLLIVSHACIRSVYNFFTCFNCLQSLFRSLQTFHSPVQWFYCFEALQYCSFQNLNWLLEIKESHRARSGEYGNTCCSCKIFRKRLYWLNFKFWRFKSAWFIKVRLGCLLSFLFHS